ncbi:MAG: hypothetical protein IJ387_11960, partial [Thermoguttaceae bacterium]|nr:hypothetical protein [Thermoguttaceae bacterium]
RLPTFEQLSGGRSPEAVRQMTGDADWGTAGSGNAPVAPATVDAAPTPSPAVPVATAPSEYDYR